MVADNVIWFSRSRDAAEVSLSSTNYDKYTFVNLTLYFGWH